jgi:hypothetical protein
VAFTVHEVRTNFSTVMPEAASLAESFLNLASPVTAKSAPPLLRHLVVPEAEAEGLDALLEQVLGHRRAGRRRGRVGLGALGGDGHRDLRIAVVADELDALLLGHLVERLLHLAHPHRGAGGERHQAVLAQLRRLLLEHGLDEVAAAGQQLVVHQA